MTGVQTCALPILSNHLRKALVRVQMVTQVAIPVEQAVSVVSADLRMLVKTEVIRSIILMEMKPTWTIY